METLTGHGSFTIQLTPEPPYDAAGGATLARLTFTKQFTGDLTGTSTGEMLSARSAVAGSAGYVAQERITGTLCGRTGSFVVQHVGRMSGGTTELSIRVVPDTGTHELTGLAGHLTIEVVEGQHCYTVACSLAPASVPDAPADTLPETPGAAAS